MLKLELNRKFLERVEGEDGITEISNGPRSKFGLKDYEGIIEENKDINMYFISFVPNRKREREVNMGDGIPRTCNKYVGGIRYFKADFDIRSYIFEHENRVISEEELLTYKDKILEGLKQDELLSTYNAVIHSGNGIHIYWIGKKIEIDSEIYSAASKELYNRIKNIFPSEPHLWPDFACRNISRLLRLPGSYNNKSKFGLPPREVEILEYKEEDSPLVGMLEEIGDKARKDEAERVKMRKNEMKNKCKGRFSKTMSQNGDTYWKINNDVSIADLVSEYTGRELSHNGKNFISNRDGEFTGAYVIPEENVVVHMGTPHFSDYFKVYSPFAFLMIHYADGDPKRTFEIAKEKFPGIEGKKHFYLNNTRKNE